MNTGSNTSYSLYSGICTASNSNYFSDLGKYTYLLSYAESWRRTSPPLPYLSVQDEAGARVTLSLA